MIITEIRIEKGPEFIASRSQLGQYRGLSVTPARGAALVSLQVCLLTLLTSQQKHTKRTPHWSCSNTNQKKV